MSTPPLTEPQSSHPDNLTLDELEHHVVAAALLDTEILELVKVRYANRLTGRLRSLFNAADGYYNLARGPLTAQALTQILVANEPDVTKHQDYLVLFQDLTSPPYSDATPADRRWILHQFDQEWQINETGQILSTAAEAMRQGHESHGKNLAGADAAWQVLSESHLRFQQLTSGGSLHEAEITATTDAAKQDYIKAVESDYQGAPLCLPEVNAALGGIRPGDIYFIAAFASEGKSFMMLNDGHAAWKHGQNVAIATGEMSLRKYRNRFVALHSNEPKFPHPLETKKIDEGTLTKDEHEVFLAVLEDIRTNSTYGKFFVFQFPHRSTPSLLFNKFAAFDQIVPLDLGVVDYLGLMTSERARVSRREELDDLIRECKALALDFSNGRGLALEVGYQTNRTSFEQARREGYYTLACFAESSEAEKSADYALWLLSIPQNPDEMKAGFIKNRDNETGEPFHIRRNLRHAQLTSSHSARGTGPSGGAADLLGI